MFGNRSTDCCPIILQYGLRPRTEPLYVGDFDFETLINRERCIACCICPMACDHEDCIKPLVLLEALSLVYERTRPDGTLVFSLYSSEFVHILSNGATVLRLHPDGQVTRYESVYELVEDLRSLP